VTGAPAASGTPDLADIQAWCQQAKPLFICGLARSGTSMLQVAFAQHGEMFNIKNCRETHIFVRPRTAVDDPIHVPTKLYLQGREQLMGYRAMVASLEARHGPLSEDDLIRTFFWFAGTAVYPGRQPLEKTPGHLKQLPRMFALFPQAKVVVCSRDPVDVTASYRKRLLKSRAEGIEESRLRWLDKTPQQMLDVFKRFTRLVTAAQPKHGKAMFMAPYEWLVESPESSLKQVCEFAQMRFDLRMLNPEAGEPSEEATDTDDDEDLDLSEFPQMGRQSPTAQIQKRESDAHKVLTADEIALIVNGTKEAMPLWRKPGVLG
jgi:hypothetical protein